MDRLARTCRGGELCPGELFASWRAWRSPESLQRGTLGRGATVINAGSYGTSKDGIEGVVFFTDLQLGASATKIEASFGDTIFPGFPGSFKSVDGVQICVFNSEPVPEPTSTALALLGALFVLRRKRP